MISGSTILAVKTQASRVLLAASGIYKQLVIKGISKHHERQLMGSVNKVLRGARDAGLL